MRGVAPQLQLPSAHSPTLSLVSLIAAALLSFTACVLMENDQGQKEKAPDVIAGA